MQIEQHWDRQTKVVSIHFKFPVTQENESSIGLGFLNPTSQLNHTDVIAFCMQLGIVRIGNDISEREGVILV